MSWVFADLETIIDEYSEKPCFGKCERCVWRFNGGCSEWNGYGNRKEDEEEDA